MKTETQKYDLADLERLKQEAAFEVIGEVMKQREEASKRCESRESTLETSG